MIFSIRGLGFELGSLLLEGWAAFAARVVCAALLLVLGWLARQLLSRRCALPAAPQLAAGGYAHSAAQLCRAAAAAHPCGVHLCRSCQSAVGNQRREQISAHSL